jgi:hypothetical protein
MMAEEVISDHPDWFDESISTEERSALIDWDFDENIAGDPEYQTADAATQGEWKLAHRQLVEQAALESKYNPSNIRAKAKQRTADRGDFLPNIATKVFDAHKGAAARVGMVDDVINPDGIVDEDFFGSASKYFQKENERITTQSERQLAKDITLWDKTTENSGLVGDVVASAKLLKDILLNPKAVASVAADSTSSITAGAMGAWGGGKVGAAAGSVIPGAGTAGGATVGASVGMFLAMAGDAASSKFMEKVREGMEEAELPLTKSNIKMFMENNPEFVQQAQIDSTKYGGVLGAVDVALGGLGSRLATLPTKVARQNAIKALTAAEKVNLRTLAKGSGKTVEEFTEDLVTSRAAQELSKRTFKQKLKGKGKAYAGEVAGEPASEAAATAAIGEEVKAEDLIYETIGGVGAGPYGTAVNVAATGSKLAKNQTGKFIQKLKDSTPESRAAAKKQKAEVKEAKATGKVEVQAAKDQARADSDVNFKKDIEETDINDRETIDAWADPENEKYDPLRAVTKLSESDSVDDLQRAKDIEIAAFNTMKETEGKLVALLDKAETGELTPAETAQMQSLDKTLDWQTETQKKLNKGSQLLRDRLNKAEADRDLKEVDVEKASPDELVASVTDSLGSSRNALPDTAIDTALENKDLTQEQRDVLINQKEANAARVALSKTAGYGKTQDDVSSDIYNGGVGFRGIDSYGQSIRNKLATGNTELANIELDRLRKFRDERSIRMNKAVEVFNAIHSPAGLTKQQERTQKELAASGLSIHKKTPSRLIAAIQDEADAITKETKLAESVIAAHSTETKVDTKPEVKKAPEPKPAKPESKKEAPAPEKKTEESTKEPVVEEKESTEAENTGTVEDDSTSVEDILTTADTRDFGDLDVKVGEDADGQAITETFTEADNKLDEQIKEAEAILKCCLR